MMNGGATHPLPKDEDAQKRHGDQIIGPHFKVSNRNLRLKGKNQKHFFSKASQDRMLEEEMIQDSVMDAYRRYQSAIKRLLV